MTNMEKDEIAAQVGTELPDDEQAVYDPVGYVLNWLQKEGVIQ